MPSPRATADRANDTAAWRKKAVVVCDCSAVLMGAILGAASRRHMSTCTHPAGAGSPGTVPARARRAAGANGVEMRGYGRVTTSVGPEGNETVSSLSDMSELMVTLRRAASALRDAGVDFALAGGYAAYARGAAEPTHDVDFVLRAEDIGDALAALTAIGMEHCDSPEDWLEKAYDDGRLVDLLH